MSSLPSIDVYSLFPEAVQGVLESSILRRAQMKGLMELNALNLRDFTTDKHKSVDEAPYGGGQGMLFKVEVLDNAMNAALASVGGNRDRLKIVYTSPRGIHLDQAVATVSSQWLGQMSNDGEARKIVVVCGRYEGVDERFVEKWVDLELSLGDFILSGGEIASLAFLDSVVRLMPGVLGNAASAREDSFSNGLLEFPQYTRPELFEDRQVPNELLSGNHAEIKRWRLKQSLLLTAAYRPDLILKHSGEGLDSWSKDLLMRLKERIK